MIKCRTCMCPFCNDRGTDREVIGCFDYTDTLPQKFGNKKVSDPEFQRAFANDLRDLAEAVNDGGAMAGEKLKDLIEIFETACEEEI